MLLTAPGNRQLCFRHPVRSSEANLTTTLPAVRLGQVGAKRQSGLIQSAVLSANISEHANIRFGSQLMYLWYEQLSVALGYTAPADSVTTWDSGNADLYRQPEVEDYSQLTFFNASPIFLANGGNIVFMSGPLSYWADSEKNPPSESYGLPNISITVDTFGKAFYSLVLSDVGVADQTNALSTWAGQCRVTLHSQYGVLTKRTFWQTRECGDVS